MFKRVLCVVAAMALFGSCQKWAEHQQLFRDMMALRAEIATEFHEAKVQVNVIRKGTVVVTFINSALNAATSEEKQKRADAVAAFVRKRHPAPEVRTLFIAQSDGGSVTRLDRYTGHP